LFITTYSWEGRGWKQSLAGIIFEIGRKLPGRWNHNNPRLKFKILMPENTFKGPGIKLSLKFPVRGP
jgi:hypothetical protein